MVSYVPFVRERILRVGSKCSLTQGTSPPPQEGLYRMNKGIDNNVKQPMPALMESEIVMGTLTFWTEMVASVLLQYYFHAH